jgi:uncharacterized membrane protein
MSEFSQIIGRFHPLLVHLPIGILLLALLFEALSRRESWRSLRPAMPLVLLLGAAAAAFSCLTGWLLSQNGDYENDLVSRHQWLAIGVAIVSISAFWLKIRRRSKAYFVCSILLLPAILLTGHWGISLTHGEGYLTQSLQEEEALEEKKSFEDLPNVGVPPPSAEAISALQKAGVVVSPVGREQQFLSLNFVNAPNLTPPALESLSVLKEQVVWLKLSSTSLSDSALVVISDFKNLTRLHLDRTNISDASLAYLQKMERLVFLNLVGTKVTAHGVETLSTLPNLKKLFLYQTLVTAGDSVFLKAKLPRVQIDMGGYQVPTLPADTTMLPLK